MYKHYFRWFRSIIALFAITSCFQSRSGHVILGILD
jgi:hypothetical protein